MSKLVKNGQKWSKMSNKDKNDNFDINGRIFVEIIKNVD